MSYSYLYFLHAAGAAIHLEGFVTSAWRSIVETLIKEFYSNIATCMDGFQSLIFLILLYFLIIFCVSVIDHFCYV